MTSREGPKKKKKQKKRKYIHTHTNRKYYTQMRFVEMHKRFISGKKTSLSLQIQAKTEELYQDQIIEEVVKYIHQCPLLNQMKSLFCNC
mgnify:FL=1